MRTLTKFNIYVAQKAGTRLNAPTDDSERLSTMLKRYIKKYQAVWAWWETKRNAATFDRAGQPRAKFQNYFDRLQVVDALLPENERSGQRGEDNLLSPAHVFVGAVALDLLDAGINIGAVGFFVTHARDMLMKTYEQIMQNPPVRVGKGGWKYDENGKDARVYLTLRYSDIHELWPHPPKSGPCKGWKGAGPHPLIVNSKIIRGMTALTEELDELGVDGNHTQKMVFELANVARIVTEKLKEAPIRKRGRQ